MSGRHSRTTPLRRWYRAVSAVLIVAAWGLATAPATRAADEPAPVDTTSPAADTSEHPVDLDLLNVLAELQDVNARLERVGSALHDARQSVLSTEASVNVTQGLIIVNNARLTEVTARVKERGVTAYTRHGEATTAPLDVARIGDLNSAHKYTRAAAFVDTEDLSFLRATETKLDDELAQKMSAFDAALAEREAFAAEQRALTARRDAAAAALARAGAIPVMGEAQLTAVQLAGWYRSTGSTPMFAAGTSIDDVAQLYIEEGRDEGVRGDIAFAQAIIETGYFRVAAGNNYSGIGVCDSCTGGYGFPTPREGVRAQIQLLRNYADKDSRAHNLTHPPSPALYGSDATKAARLYDTFFLKGKAPLWNMMGGGNWATDPVYAPKVIGLHARMVAWAQLHPTGAP